MNYRKKGQNYQAVISGHQRQ